MGQLTETRRPQALPAAVTIAASVVAIAGLGGLASDVRSEWYISLEKPSWQPPGWVFGPVWTVLYALLAVSAFLAWRDAHGPRRRPLLALYAANGPTSSSRPSSPSSQGSRSSSCSPRSSRWLCSSNPSRGSRRRRSCPMEPGSPTRRASTGRSRCRTRLARLTMHRTVHSLRTSDRVIATEEA